MAYPRNHFAPLCLSIYFFYLSPPMPNKEITFLLTPPHAASRRVRCLLRIRWWLAITVLNDHLLASRGRRVYDHWIDLCQRDRNQCWVRKRNESALIWGDDGWTRTDKNGYQSPPRWKRGKPYSIGGFTGFCWGHCALCRLNRPVHNLTFSTVTAIREISYSVDFRWRIFSDLYQQW